MNAIGWSGARLPDPKHGIGSTAVNRQQCTGGWIDGDSGTRADLLCSRWHLALKVRNAGPERAGEIFDSQLCQHGFKGIASRCRVKRPITVETPRKGMPTANRSIRQRH
jgi:hypothetical protein